jgi:hypothetical protein
MRKAILLSLSVWWVVCCTSRRQEISQQPEDTTAQAVPPPTAPNKDYALVRVENGIYVEQFDSTQTDADRYNQNNRIYRVGHSFTYSYEYQDTTGRRYHSKSTWDGWAFVPVERTDPQTIKQVIIRVQPGGMGDDYNQTVISYHYPPNPISGSSGVIENERNVWMHPPRDGLFRILELNPFPFIQAPYRTGNQWRWELGIGSQWGDKRWKEWEGRITNGYQYRITGRKEIRSKLGTLLCWEVTAEAQSELGKTALLAYFNEEHGFVQLDYTNIDGSRLFMELVAHGKK